MFVNGVQVISAKLETINLDFEKMQPKSERPPMCPKGQVPILHLTPTTCPPQEKDKNQKASGCPSPWLLKPKHDIPPTPPPQTEPQPFFPQRFG